MQKIRSKYDVIVIGAGVVGNAIARELSRYKIKIAVLEKELDVGMGASSRNSGVVHSGINYKSGSLRAILSVEGNNLLRYLCKELKVKISYIGKLTVAQDEKDEQTLYSLKEQGEANGVPGLKLLNSQKMKLIQPGIEGFSALYSPTTGIISPYGLTIALAENAITNGVKFHLGCKVCAIKKYNDKFVVKTSVGKDFEASIVINSAGLHSDQISNMLGMNDYRIFPCRGEYLVLDKHLANSLSVLVYPAPRKNSAGLGIHLTSTVDGNILIGPSDEYIDDRSDYSCTADIINKLIKKGHELLPSLSTLDVIRTFSGLRAKQTPPEIKGYKDFVIEIRKDVPGFINLVGIESPGLTASPAIALRVKDMVSQILPLVKKIDFIPERPGRVGHVYELPFEERAELVAKDPAYGEIICRCEQITKKEIIDAIQNPFGSKLLSGIKYRSRAMMGRCQGAFCMPKIVQILKEDFGYKPEDYLLKSTVSPLFRGYVRRG